MTTEIEVRCPCCERTILAEVYPDGDIESTNCGCFDFLEAHFSGGGELYDRKLREAVGEVTEDDVVDADHQYERMREEALR